MSKTTAELLYTAITPTTKDIIANVLCNIAYVDINIPDNWQQWIQLLDRVKIENVPLIRHFLEYIIALPDHKPEPFGHIKWNTHKISICGSDDPDIQKYMIKNVVKHWYDAEISICFYNHVKFIVDKLILSDDKLTFDIYEYRIECGGYIQSRLTKIYGGQRTFVRVSYSNGLHEYTYYQNKEATQMIIYQDDRIIDYHSYIDNYTISLKDNYEMKIKLPPKKTSVYSDIMKMVHEMLNHN